MCIGFIVILENNYCADLSLSENMSLWCAIWLINLGVEDNQFGNEALQLIWPVDEISAIGFYCYMLFDISNY